MHIEVRQSVEFRAWMLALKDARARKSIAQRITRLGLGLMGDVKSVGDGVMEMRINHGPGYRAYFRTSRRPADHAALRRGQRKPGAGYRTRQGDGG